MTEAFLADIWRRKFFIVYMIFLGAVFALVLRSFVPREKYVYSMDYYVTNSELSKIIVDTSSLSTDSKMASSCRIILRSPMTMSALGEMLLEKYGEDYLKRYFTLTYEDDKVSIDEEQLSDCIDIEVVDEGASALSIDVTTENMYLSQDIGNFLTFLAPNVVYYLVGVDYISPYENARLTVDLGIFDSRKLTAAAGAAAGAVLAYIFILIYKLFEEHIILGSGDILHEMKLPLLGQIPYYEIETREESSITEGNN